MSWTIRFLENAPNLDEVATRVQAQTYRVVKEALTTSKKVTVEEILDKLELKNPLCLFSRLEHLQEKGFLTLVKPPTMAA